MKDEMSMIDTSYLQHLRILGCDICQIQFCIQYFEAMTGKDPRKLRFGADAEPAPYKMHPRHAKDTKPGHITWLGE